LIFLTDVQFCDIFAKITFIRRLSLVWSYVLEYENNRNPFEARRNSIFGWKEIAVKSIVEFRGNSVFRRNLDEDRRKTV